MFWSEINNTLLLIDRLSPKPKLFIQSNKYYHTRIGFVMSIFLLVGFSILITYFIVEFFKGSGVVVIYSKDTSENLFYYNMTNKLFAFNITSSTKGSIDPRAIEFKVNYLEYHRTNITTVEVAVDKCDFQKYLNDGSYNEAYKSLDSNNFYCINTTHNNVGLYYSPKDWSGSYYVVYLKTCSNTSKNEDYCYTQDIIDEYMKQDNFFFTFVVDNVEIDHYNKSNPVKMVKYFHTLKLSYKSRTEMVIYWRQVDYLSDNGWIFDKISSITSYQLDQTLNQQTFNSNGEYNYLDTNFSKIQFQLYSTTIDKYKRTYPKIQTVLASISGIVQVMFYISYFVVYISSTGQYYYSFMNIFSPEISKKEEKTKTFMNTINFNIGSDVNGSNIQFNSCSPSKTDIIYISNIMNERKTLSKIQAHSTKNNKNTKENAKDQKNKSPKRITCVKSFLWYLSSGKKKSKSTLSLVEKFVRAQLSVEKIIYKLSTEHKKICRAITNHKAKYIDNKDCNLTKNISNSNCINNSMGCSPKREYNHSKFKDSPLKKQYISYKTLSERPKKSNTMIYNIISQQN